MAHIPIPNSLPGISGLLTGFPETGKPLRDVAMALLRGPSSLSVGERELLATYVSYRNGCRFCWMSHGAITASLLSITKDQLLAMLQDGTALDPKMRALFKIAESVRATVHPAADADVAAARAAGADDTAVHHAILIAAAFCMYNRYVEGMKTTAPEAFEAYAPMAQHLIKNGYK